MIMRSIGLKLTLAFLLLGLSVTGLVSFAVSTLTPSVFDQFLVEQVKDEMVTDFQSYYLEVGSWQDIELFLDQEQGLLFDPWEEPFFGTLADVDGEIIWEFPEMGGSYILEEEQEISTPIQVYGETVGWVLFDPMIDMIELGGPEEFFLNDVRQAIRWSALGGGLIALVLGVLLARTLTHPLHDLISATKRVSQGELGYQVSVRSQDELGQLASSFNQMSTDLAEASRQRQQMTADIAHDLRTPLSIILGYTEALHEGKLQGTSQIYEVVHTHAKHLNHLIDDLRTLSLADAGELPLNRQWVAPQTLLDRAAAAHQIQAQAKGIDLRVETNLALPKIAVDLERMAQVLGNLVSNALRYTPEQGEIVLRAEADAHSVWLTIQDNGDGIAPEDQPYIFERFYQADKSRSKTAQSGLGLPIAKSIVEAHGGRISVESVVGEGTVFSIGLRK